MKKLIFAFILLIVLANFIHPVFHMNDADCAFEQGPCGDPSPNAAQVTRLSLKSLIKQGAMYFFESAAQFNIYLKEFEIDNFSPLQGIIIKSLTAMRSATDIYEELIKESLQYNYNQSFIRALRDFDYAEYREENTLIGPMFRKVKRFLIRGDVRGALEEILKMNREIEADLESLQFLKGIPDKQVVWRINQKFIKSKLFGQYCAEVFSQIINNRE